MMLLQETPPGGERKGAIPMTDRTYPHLCSPITIRNVTFRHRMCSAPMGSVDIPADGCLGRAAAKFYELRARGGAAAVTASEVIVDPATDGTQGFFLDNAIPGSLQGAATVADAITRHGAVASIELNHCGQYAKTYLSHLGNSMVYGPNEGVREDGMPIHALTADELAQVAAAFGRAAAVARQAGFQMVTVHMGHGWLLNQFLSPYFNHRTDEYGGSLENRVRFPRQVLQAIRDAAGPGLLIEVRMSGAEAFEGGYGVDEGARIAHAIEDLTDIIHVSAGSFKYGFAVTHPPMFSEHGCNVHLAAEIKKHVSVPVATVGALNDPAQMEEILATGQADLIMMGRALLADPELPDKVMAGREDDIVRCLRCFTCMAQRAIDQTRRCAINPRIGREQDGLEVVPARHSRRVLVAGGGVGGMEAAVTAARRGHRVVLCEKSERLGGILNSEWAIPFKYEMYQLGQSLARQLEQEGVEVRLNTPVDPDYVRREAPDALIVALGSHPIVPPLPGIHGDNVIVVNRYDEERARVTGEVVVLGGGLAGCECAIHLAREGKSVHVVEMRDELAPDANPRHRPILLDQMARLTTVHTGLRGVEVTGEGLVCEDGAGQRVLVPGSTVICAVGQRANRDEAEALRDCAPWVRLIGDCVRPSNITNAVYQGYHAALDVR